MGEPRTLGELLAECESDEWGHAVDADDCARHLRRILHGTDEAPGLVERIHDEVHVVAGIGIMPSELSRALAAEIALPKEADR